MYKLIIDFETKEVINNGIRRIHDNAFIPFSLDNTDYQKYLEWVAAGNTPEPADE